MIINSVQIRFPRLFTVNYHHAKTCYTKNDHSCVFPFNYEGKTYKNCIYGEESESWCPYEIKADLTSAKMDWCKEANCSEVTIRDSDSQSHTTTEIGMDFTTEEYYAINIYIYIKV